ncbi:chondroitinase-B domain-containing protein [Marinigracilibium pacificum]|uniref:Alginate lyase n=1 Tax=Marinigracilibium pacificum TaxID=2729599 RepID=A0A848J3F2_9BACT|nr:chondroitinase-B domain-containing protein [Marinigracilibium pacificum]NMM48879.1 alginate lyase [Marinigracilibium pacificum]
MNKTIICYLFTIVLLFSCGNINKPQEKLVNNNAELKEILEDIKPGDVIVLAKGTWENLHLIIKGYGTQELPIILKGEIPGEVFIEGESYLKLGGEYIIVKDLIFRNGYTPENSVIDFKIDKDLVANNCRVTNCVIINFNQLQRNISDHWVEFSGRNNRLDHSYLSGKTNDGPTVRIRLAGNQNILNHHKIDNNHFGPRPRKGGPHGETIQIGSSETSMTPSYTLISNNLFERCNGEVEVISNKSNFNEFNNNIFYKCEGSLVMRHGNYCRIDGNMFIGDSTSDVYGGIRIVNSGHWVINNYFYQLKGSQFRAPLSVMNGIPKSPLNRYNQVTDLTVAYNSWVECENPMQFGVGVNIDQKDVLPSSEIRSARPIRTIVANNLIYNKKGTKPIIAYDQIDGVSFFKNYINKSPKDTLSIEGIQETKFNIDNSNSEIIKIQTKENYSPYQGFDFDSIDKDLFGNSRKKNTYLGAFAPTAEPINAFSESLYGPSWFSKSKDKDVHTFKASANNLIETLNKASDGDIIELTDSMYVISSSLEINKELKFISGTNFKNIIIQYKGSPDTPLFKLFPYGSLYLEGINLIGNKEQIAFAPKNENMSGHYNLSIKNCDISNFNYVIKGYKHSFADSISISSSSISNCTNGIDLSGEKDNKGDYNAEFLIITNTLFTKINKNVINFYRGGYDESTIGGNLIIKNSQFNHCGEDQPNNILINNHGIINVTIENNQFESNPVDLVALLWGSKNNTQKSNRLINSGEIKVVNNLKQSLMY